MFRLRIAALAALLAASGTAALPAHAADSMKGMTMDKARYSDVGTYAGAPNLPLTLSVVVAGGGPKDFKAETLVGTLAGSLTAAEVKSLTAKFGAANVASFLTTFDFVIGDALRLVQKNHIALPATPEPAPTDGKALSAALYTAGVTPGGRFDVEYMLDHLTSHPLHVEIMNDIDANAKLGPKADANYHVVLYQAMQDLKAAYKL